MVSSKKNPPKNSVKPPQTPPKKKRRKRRGHYITGVHKSLKCSKDIKYRSGWELEVCKFLDADDSVEKYDYEGVIIPYLSNVRTGKMRRYFPDFLITYSSGKQKLVEVKSKSKLLNPKVIKKTAAGKQWSEENGVAYEIWTENMINAIKQSNKLLEEKEVPKKQKPKKPKSIRSKNSVKSSEKTKTSKQILPRWNLS